MVTNASTPMFLIEAGNTEFDSAALQTLDALKAMNSPELEWFLNNCLQAFTLNLDQL